MRSPKPLTMTLCPGLLADADRDSALASIEAAEGIHSLLATQSCHDVRLRAGITYRLYMNINIIFAMRVTVSSVMKQVEAQYSHTSALGKNTNKRLWLLRARSLTMCQVSGTTRS